MRELQPGGNCLRRVLPCQAIFGWAGHGWTWGQFGWEQIFAAGITLPDMPMSTNDAEIVNQLKAEGAACSLRGAEVRRRRQSRQRPRVV